jgi:hypothetical protein
MVMMMDMTMWV